jgi:hypothetical protein
MSQEEIDIRQQFSNIDQQPDWRSDAERLNSPLSLYNHQSRDLAMMERNAEELINLTGAWLTIFRRTRNTGHKDEVWDEDADPTYSNGVKMKGKFAPEPAEAVLTKWGVDIPNNTIIHFSRAAVIKEFGKRMIAEGDIIIVPHNTMSVLQSTDLRDGPANRIDTYRVVKASDTQNFKYRWLYWSCLVQNITGDASIQVDFRQEHS